MQPLPSLRYFRQPRQYIRNFRTSGMGYRYEQEPCDWVHGRRRHDTTAHPVLGLEVYHYTRRGVFLFYPNMLLGS